MTLPGSERAVVQEAKLREYVLNPFHPRGRHKARVFASALNILQKDVRFLRDWLREAALNGEAAIAEVDQYGHRYTLELECVHGARRAVVRSAWIVLSSEDFPRLVTCYVLSEQEHNVWTGIIVGCSAA